MIAFIPILTDRNIDAVVEFTRNGAVEEAVLLKLKSLSVNSTLGSKLIVDRGRPPMLVAIVSGVDITQCTVEWLKFERSRVSKLSRAYPLVDCRPAGLPTITRQRPSQQNTEVNKIGDKTNQNQAITVTHPRSAAC